MSEPVPLGAGILGLFLILVGNPLASPSVVLPAPPPAVFFTDLDSGPKSGGQNNKGVFVTIYGRRFGRTQKASTVTFGGGTVDNCPVWSDSRVTCQLGGSVTSGPVVVTVEGQASNKTVNFTVRSAGKIYFVSPSGSDSNNGSFAAPFKAILKCRDAMSSGDACYLEDGLVQNRNDGSGWHSSMLITKGGKPGEPKAFVAYPNATVQLGDANGCSDGSDQRNGIRNTGSGWVTISGGGGNWTIIGGCASAVVVGDVGGWRVVGTKIECPNGNAPEGCFEASLGGDPNGVKFLGNEVTDVSTNRPQGSSKQYHAVYFTTDTNHVEAAWNNIHDNNDCRAIQFHSSPTARGSGRNQFDLHVHDNLIHGDPCDGINFATIDPSQGTIEAYNNVIYSVGRGPDPPDGSANYACIYFPGIVNTGSSGSGTVLIYNNTMYDCGSHAGPFRGSGAVGRFDGSNPRVLVKMQNNIILQIDGEDYFESGTTGVIGDHNLFFANGAPPSGLSNSLNSDPQFFNLSEFNFRLRSTSPAINAGVDTGILMDIEGIPRPQGKSFDLGAFEFFSAAAQKQNHAALRGRDGVAMIGGLRTAAKTFP
ncbi:MAG: choice-of-anchor Q domain-containing protein [Candidatus Acidiferrales bacterium]